MTAPRIDPSKLPPGPWRALRSHETYDGEGYYCALDEEEKAYLESRPYVRIEAADGTTICTAHDLFEFRSPEIAHAVAALPEILQQREELVALVTEFLNDAETMREPYRNEAICERARTMLEKHRESQP